MTCSQPHEPTYATDGNLLEKLELSFERNSQSVCKSKLKCCHMKTVFKRVGVLFAFHMLNVLLAIIGIIAALLALAGLVMSLCWIMILLVVGVGAIPFWILLALIPERLTCLILLCYGLVVASYLALYVYSWFNIYTVLAPYALLLGGGFGLLFFYPSFFTILFLVKIDARLMNFVAPVIPFSSTAQNGLDPELCAKRFNLERKEDIWLLPMVIMAFRSWTIIFYFAVIKTIFGVSSAATIFFVVIQPVTSLFSGGSAPFFASSMTIHNDPVVYVGVIAIVCVAGVVGLVLVATLSVKVTSCTLSEWEVTQDATQGEIEIQAATQTTISPRAEFELAVA
ncbi:hypothetical protein PHMEG_00017459 [Phytophthora megakarya]|uniref:Transmembrane protein n=1 Tax=Phytophthora megakarya TaxID=4795 RepID=A0A225VXV4_9STRA|nr:hypothetical protein PHMEG_00017459 [Phytophthora megakarya]